MRVSSIDRDTRRRGALFGARSSVNCSPQLWRESSPAKDRIVTQAGQVKFRPTPVFDYRDWLQWPPLPPPLSRALPLVHWLFLHFPSAPSMLHSSFYFLFKFHVTSHILERLEKSTVMNNSPQTTTATTPAARTTTTTTTTTTPKRNNSNWLANNYMTDSATQPNKHLTRTA